MLKSSLHGSVLIYAYSSHLIIFASVSGSPPTDWWDYSSLRIGHSHMTFDFFPFLSVLGIDPRDSQIFGRASTTDLYR